MDSVGVLDEVVDVLTELVVVVLVCVGLGVDLVLGLGVCLMEPSMVESSSEESEKRWIFFIGVCLALRKSEYTSVTSESEESEPVRSIWFWASVSFGES